MLQGDQACQVEVVVGGRDQISLPDKGAGLSQVLLEEGEEGGQVMFVGVRMPETVTFARVNLFSQLQNCYLHFTVLLKILDTV